VTGCVRSDHYSPIQVQQKTLAIRRDVVARHLESVCSPTSDSPPPSVPRGFGGNSISRKRAWPNGLVPPAKPSSINGNLGSESRHRYSGVAFKNCLTEIVSKTRAGGGPVPGSPSPGLDVASGGQDPIASPRRMSIGTVFFLMSLRKSSIQQSADGLRSGAGARDEVAVFWTPP
jgi:hypothetical protein